MHFDYFLPHFVTQNNSPDQMPGFILRLVLEDKKIKFDPAIAEFEESLLSLYDMMFRVVQSIPRVETRLYAEWVSGHKDSIDSPRIQQWLDRI